MPPNVYAFWTYIGFELTGLLVKHFFTKNYFQIKLKIQFDLKLLVLLGYLVPSRT